MGNSNYVHHERGRMNYVKYTQFFILFLVAGIAIWDVWVIIQGGTEASISNQLIVYAYKYPAMPFAVGFVCGHLFWKMPDTKSLKEARDGDKSNG